MGLRQCYTRWVLSHLPKRRGTSSYAKANGTHFILQASESLLLQRRPDRSLGLKLITNFFADSTLLLLTTTTMTASCTRGRSLYATFVSSLKPLSDSTFRSALSERRLRMLPSGQSLI